MLYGQERLTGIGLSLHMALILEFVRCPEMREKHAMTEDRAIGEALSAGRQASSGQSGSEKQPVKWGFLALSAGLSGDVDVDR